MHRHTGTAPSVALHIPWDRVEDFEELREQAAALGAAARRDQPEPLPGAGLQARQRLQPRPARSGGAAVDHILDCVAIAARAGSDAVSLWLADGTNYPGQDSLAGRRERLVASLQEVYAALPETIELLVEYKLYEPAFYSTDLADWGSALDALPGARPPRARARRPRPSRPGRQHRADRLAPAAAWAGSAASTSTTASTATTT